ncbi:MAG: hypothetical protein ACUVTL_03875 [Thermoproteota archaeon]
MNGYAEGMANVLRRKGRMPTSETLLSYVKKLTGDEISPTLKPR